MKRDDSAGESLDFWDRLERLRSEPASGKGAEVTPPKSKSIERAEKVVKEVGGRLVFTVPPDYGAPSDLPTHLRGLQTICSCIHGSFARELQRAIALQINDAVVGVQEEHVEQWIERNRRDARIFTFCLIGAFLIGLGGGILWGVL